MRTTPDRSREAREDALMSQRSVEIVLGKLLTDEAFRRSFFPVRAASFELARLGGLELTAVERDAFASLRPRAFETMARALDARLLRYPVNGSAGDDGPDSDPV